MIRRARAITLVELLVSVTIALMVVVVAYEAFHVLFRSEKTTDREASRALLEAELLEMLFQDIRSATLVSEVSTGTYEIRRLVLSGSKLTERTVRWTLGPQSLVTRQEEGGALRQFAFVHLIDPNDPPFKLRLERLPEGRFVK